MVVMVTAVTINVNVIGVWALDSNVSGLLWSVLTRFQCILAFLFCIFKVILYRFTATMIMHYAGILFYI